MSRLQHETSPYLRQHASNPVDWYPWGDEALARARAEDKPILLSIGYAACHWCHVMAHESFEDAATAAVMNEHFVNIKVDREERPDLDAIYMQAVQAMTGHGGWPMTVFLTPAGEPFYGGTYFPPADRHGMPSFRRVLAAVHDAWRTRRDAVTSTTQQLRELYAAAQRTPPGAGRPDAAVADRAARALARSYDRIHGGFGGAPKFPPSMTLDFLLRHWRRTGTTAAYDMATETFLAMARGGISDQVGGGLHRYSVDERWLVPHFEKMLYDNALFASLGVKLWQIGGDDEIREATTRTLDWLAREMTSPGGGFHSSLDADSEGVEGKYYVWSDDVFRELLGDDAARLAEYWGVTREGNFEGENILHVAVPPATFAERHGLASTELQQVVARGRLVLAAARGTRVRPGLDDKIIASWNGLMLRAVCIAARAFGDPALAALARRNGDFLRRAMVHEGRVIRSCQDRPAQEGAPAPRGTGFLEDHAAVALAFLELHALTFDVSWLEEAVSIGEVLVARFRDNATGRFFDTPSDHEPLITRPREVTDNATPAGGSLAAELLLHLAVLTGEPRWRTLADDLLGAAGDAPATYPNAFGHLLGAIDTAVHGVVEVALVGDVESPSFHTLAATIGAAHVPAMALTGGTPAPESVWPLLRHRTPRGAATAYVCRQYVCDEPAGDPATLRTQLERAARGVAGNG